MIFGPSLVERQEYPDRDGLLTLAWIIAGPAVWLGIGLFVWKVLLH
jgi:hypothetical protein